MNSPSILSIGQLFVHAHRLHFPIEAALIAHRGLLNDANTATFPQVLSHYLPVVEDLTQRHNGNDSRVIVCINCQHVLGHQHNILEVNDGKQLDTMLKAFISRFVDSFWKGYRPAHPHGRAGSISAVEEGGECVVMEPTEWMVTQCYTSSSTSVPSSRIALTAAHSTSIGGSAGTDVQPDANKKRSISSLQAEHEEQCAPGGVPSAPPVKSIRPSGKIVLYCPHCRTECGHSRVQCLSLCLSHVLVDSFVLRKECFRKKRLLSK